MAPLTPDEIIAHPEFKNVIWELPYTTKGKVDVGKGRGGPFELAYEVYGKGPIHLVWVMGLGAFKTAWQRQTKDFGVDRGVKYSSLIFDNRGMAESDKPSVRYTTLEMAKDVVELVDHLGWTESRQLHVIGVSMGGMIAQEMGLLIPERICSLSLVSTAARIVNTVGFIENLRNRINLFIPRPLAIQIETVKHNLFSDEWLALPDADASSPYSLAGGFPTNGDRFAAHEMSKRLDKDGFTRKGFLLQLVAAGWHHKSAAQLTELGYRVGRDRIQVMHGDIDRMITPPHGVVLTEELGGAGKGGIKSTIFEGVGHVLAMERRNEFRILVEELAERTEQMGGINPRN